MKHTTTNNAIKNTHTIKHECLIQNSFSIGETENALGSNTSFFQLSLTTVILAYKTFVFLLINA